ncbi:MAG: hypothetical protein K0R18_378 [Bacillales bacterium]|jgi:hypothetical protein|nr:hypothetical protein [Bacillales bacterium]
MAIKITATTVEEFQRIEKQIKLINNEELIKKFGRADASIIGFLTLHPVDFMSNNKLYFPKTVSINRVEFSSSEQPRLGHAAGEMETIYNVRIWTKITPENLNNEDDGPFEAVFNACSKQPVFEISAR